MKKLPRVPMRPEDEPGVDKALWRPTWKCFCCHDTGIVRSHLAATVIDGYDSNQDKLPRCQNPGCNSGSHFDGESLTHCIDYRLTSEICQELDANEREVWNETLLKQHQYRIDTSKIGRNFRKRDRTPEEEMEAQQKHQEASQR